MRLGARFALVAMLVGSSPAIFAQPSAVADAAATQAEVSFHIDRPGLAVPKFTVRVREDGSGSYQAEEVEGPSDRGTVRYTQARQIERTLNLTPAMMTKIFKAARELKYFHMDCASKAKNIASTGEKTLSYAGADGKGSCAYNYSENKQIKMLTDDFLAIAETLDEGRRLAYLHRYDRLGLDAETISLEQAAAAGRATELGTIAPVLSSIAGDPSVMERVRLRVAKLLERAGNKI